MNASSNPSTVNQQIAEEIIESKKLQGNMNLISYTASYDLIFLLSLVWALNEQDGTWYGTAVSDFCCWV